MTQKTDHIAATADVDSRAEIGSDVTIWHLAQVRDDSGRTTAVLFLEDIIEELIGEVQDATRRGLR